MYTHIFSLFLNSFFKRCCYFCFFCRFWLLFWSLSCVGSSGRPRGWISTKFTCWSWSHHYSRQNRLVIHDGNRTRRKYFNSADFSNDHCCGYYGLEIIDHGSNGNPHLLSFRFEVFQKTKKSKTEDLPARGRVRVGGGAAEWGTTLSGSITRVKPPWGGPGSHFIFAYLWDNPQ